MWDVSNTFLVLRTGVHASTCRQRRLITSLLWYVVDVRNRQMCGVHYRFDSQEGLLLGEIVAVRLLQQVSIRTRDID